MFVRRLRRMAVVAISLAVLLVPMTVADEKHDAGEDDPYLWLEDVDGEKALEWVRAQNERSASALKKNPEFANLYEQALAALNNESRIPSVAIRGKALYNFWRDSEHPRGVYRRTTLSEFRKTEPKWETVLDIDALAKKEEKQWVFKGMSCLPPAETMCMVRLSPGGGDAVEMREFDLTTLSFVEDGYFLPTAKGSIDWIDENTLFVGTDFGDGSLTESGYPRIAKIWKRGTPLAEAQTIYEGSAESVSAGAYRIRTDDGDIDLVQDSTSFWTSRRYQIVEGKLLPFEIQDSANVVGGYLGKLVLYLQEDWTRGEQTWKEGTVLIASPESLRGGEGSIEVLVEPGKGEVVEDVSTTKKGILVTILENVRGRLYRYEKNKDRWARSQVPFPDNGAIHVTSVDDETGDFFAEYESFTTPSTLFFIGSEDLEPVEMKAQAATFDGSKYVVEQFWAESKDGTRVPYFVVMAKGTKRDGKNPTHIFSYGGFRNSLTPSYSGSYEALSGAYGKLWLERGGVFVSANIRGGGEFGPSWHSAALKENRHKSFEDFEAVAEDLIKRKITSAGQIGIEGRSNGGLLVTATMTRRPELYGAVICGVPLTDMKRYHKLLAGASWMAEYGNPDVPEEWNYIKDYSPYQNLAADRDYPPIFFFGSTRDDRVHPGHGRKMVARMLELGYEKVYLYENTEGGHGGSVTNEQLALRLAYAYSHLWNELGGNEGTD